MKKLLLVLMLGAACFSRGQGLEIIKISQFPITTTLQTNYLFLVAIPNTGNRALSASFFLDAIAPFSTNMSNIFSLFQSITNNNSFVNQSNLVSLRDGYMMPVAAKTANTNLYWWDFGRTTNGQHMIYGSVDGTNSVQFCGVTNGLYWQPFSFNVIARGGNINLFMPTNLPHFDTNKWTLSGSLYTLSLTNGNEFGMSLQSNQIGGAPTLSTIWRLSGQ